MAFGVDAHVERRDEEGRDERADGGAGHDVPLGAGDVDRAACSGEGPEVAAGGNGHEAGAGVEGAFGHGVGLLGVARVGDREGQGARPDERRGADLLEHDDRDGERGPDGAQHVAGDAGAAHAEHGDVVDAVGAGQP